MDLQALALEAALVAAALGVLLGAAFRPLPNARTLGRLLALFVAILAAASVVLTPTDAVFFAGTYRLDAWALLAKTALLVLAPFVFLLAAECAPQLESAAAEFYAVLLLALAGMLVLVSASDLILLFVALELVTVCFYVLTAWQHRRLPTIAAATRYLILGALATGFTAYGLAYVAGIAGATPFAAVAAALRAGGAPGAALKLGILFLLAGLSFKLAAVPGHMWVPDVYQAAPAPAVALLASASKVAAVAALVRLLVEALWPARDFWLPVIVLLAAASLLYGAYGGLQQGNLRRLLGYSAIAQAGFVLVGVTALQPDAPRASAVVFFYAVQYALASLCLFIVAELLRGADSREVTLETLPGLLRRSPLLTVALTGGLLSLAGVPPLSGFLAKLLVFLVAFDRAAGNPWILVLLALAAVAAVVALCYYFRFIRAAWRATAEPVAPLVVPWPLAVTLVLLLAALVLLGVWPGLVLNRF